jgi:uncharacterized protein (DUF1800 family)
VDEVIRIGLEKWFEQQLEGNLTEDTVEARLAGYQFLNLSNEQAIQTFPKPLQILRMASEDGLIPKDSIKLLDRDETKKRLSQYVKDKNIHQQSELVREFINQRIIRSIYARNQLKEVLTGFWFNHFNISLTKPTVILLAPAYERDCIRPHVTGKFETMLKSTAQSPAMLVYLDNFISTGENDSLLHPEVNVRLNKLLEKFERTKDSATAAQIEKIRKLKQNSGLNENYARELMELHTLGVDGGYTQNDVTQAARVLTGWGIYPIEEGFAPKVFRLIKEKKIDLVQTSEYVREGDFLFSMNRHDAKPKTVLGYHFPAGGGKQEGDKLLTLLAHHPSTARFICKKMATYFVRDEPSMKLVDKMAKTFLQTDGDLKAILRIMAYSNEFWDKANMRQKTKSPFELVVSACRALNADVQAPYALFTRLDRMGQKIFYYQAPTGFPDRATYWINTGALLNRMNFGLDLAASSLRGTQVDLMKLNHDQEPGDPVDALRTYSGLLLPERELEPTLRRLTPLLTDPQLGYKVMKAAGSEIKPRRKSEMEESFDEEEAEKPVLDSIRQRRQAIINRKTLAQIVGVILGSPEFQRR